MADAISKVFLNLRNSIIGAKSAKIDKEIDDSLQKIETYSSKTSRNRYIETLKSLVKQTGADAPDSLIKELQSNRIESYEQFGRLQRYKEYDAIISKISYCDRALKVITDNVISPDDITKRSILILRENDNAQKKPHVDSSITRLREIERAIHLEKHISPIINKTLKKGDLFVEILHSPHGENAFTILHEEKKLFFTDPPILIETKRVQANNEEEDIKINVIMEYTPGGFGGALTGISPQVVGFSATDTGLSTTHVAMNTEPISKDKHINGNNKPEERFKSKADKLTGEDTETVELKDIFIAIHDPRYVVRLETERFRTCLGYLLFPKIDPTSLSMGSLSMGVSAVDNICAKIIDQLQTKLQTGQSNNKINVGPELRETIYNYLKTVKSNDDLKVRYIPPELMVHWRLNVDRFYPYGESIFEVVNFDCKLFMALKVATTIKKLTSATDKRIISVETGLPRDAKNLVEMIKEGMRKRKISVDSFGSIDSIPSQIATFEDIYLPQRDGKKYVEFENVQWGSNPQDDIEPMKFMRDNIVANLGVPAPFLGLEENTCISFNEEIPLLQGFSIPVSKLVEEYEKDPANFNQWTYSIDENKNVVAGKIIAVKRTRKNAEMVKVWLDNDKGIECTPDHLFMLRDRTYREAKDLKENDALMPFYIKPSGYKTRNNVPYFQVYNPGKEKWQVIHRMVAESLENAKPNDGMHVHHVDENPLNNHPDNLYVCSRDKHNSIHLMECRFDPKNPKTHSILETRKCIICNNDFSCKIQSNQNTCLSDACKKERKRLDGIKSWEKRKLQKGNDYNKVTAKCAVCEKEFETYQKYLDEKTEKWITCGDYSCGRKITGLRNTYNIYGDNEVLKLTCSICNKEYEIDVRQEHTTNTCSIKCMNTVLARRRFEGNRQLLNCSFCGTEIYPSEYERKMNRYIPCSDEFCKSLKQGVELWLNHHPDSTIQDYVNERKEPEYLNHKVVRVEKLTERQDCCDLEIEKYHNFALASGVFVHNSNRALLSVENIVFCRSIIALQHELSIPLRELFEKIYTLVHKKPEDLFELKITFREPKISPYEHEMEYVEQMQRLIEAYKQLGIPETYLKRKYLPDLNWDEIDSYSAQETINKELNADNKPDDGMMGGLGGMGGSLGGLSSMPPSGGLGGTY